MNDYDTNQFPLAYLITIRSYGTWLHGDERNSVDRVNHRYGTLMLPPDQQLVNADAGQLLHPPVKFEAEHRVIIDKAIREVCAYREYELFAINVRTNYVHIVVAAVCKPELIMNSFKSYATRQLRSAALLAGTIKPWSRHGSTRYLWKERHVEIAVDYVANGQGEVLPQFS